MPEYERISLSYPYSTVNAYMCKLCGTVVWVKKLHDEYHGKVIK